MNKNYLFDQEILALTAYTRSRDVRAILDPSRGIADIYLKAPDGHFVKISRGEKLFPAFTRQTEKKTKLFLN